jgi:predicted lipid-binding transport protein (Tim44 family)
VVFSSDFSRERVMPGGKSTQHQVPEGKCQNIVRSGLRLDASRFTKLGDAGFKDMEMRIEIGPKPSMVRAMKSRSFAFQLPRPRGIPGALALGLIVVLVVGAVALLLLFSAAVVITGLAVSACAALYFAARRKLAGAFPKTPQFEAAQPSTSMVVAREIEVEVLPRRER